MQRITEKQNNVVITDRMWARLLASTNQPSFLSTNDIVQVHKRQHSQSQLLNGDENESEITGKQNTSTA